MKTSRTILMLSYCMFLSYLSIGQQISFNASEKVSDAFFQDYIGKVNDDTYILASDMDLKNIYDMSHKLGFSQKGLIRLLKYNSKFDEPQSIALEFKYKVAALTCCFLGSDNKVNIVYLGGEGKNIGFYEDIFDLNGDNQSTNTITHVKMKSMFDMIPNLYSSANHSWFFYNQGSDAMVFDNNFKIVWQKELNYLDKLAPVTVLDDGSIMAKMQKDKSDKAPKFLIKVGTDENIKEIELDENAQYEIDPSSKTINMITLTGDETKHKNDIKAKGYDLAIYNIADLSLIKKYTVPFSDDVLLKATNSRKIEHVKGISNLTLQHVFLSGEGKEPLVILQEYEVIQQTYSSGANSMSTSTTTYFNYGDIIITRIKDDGSTVQQIIDRKSSTLIDKLPIASMFSAYQDGKIYILYNKGEFWKGKLETYSFSKDMEQLAHAEIDTYHDNDIFLDVRSAIKLTNDKYLILGSWGKKIGTAFLTL